MKIYLLDKHCMIILLGLLLSISSCQNEINETTPPPMGWNSWNWFGKHQINEDIVREVIDAMVDSGLKDAGYDVVVIDGGWRDTVLDQSGRLVAHPNKFPNGIQPLAQYAKERGLRLGLHVVPGTHDCIGDKVGSYGKEELHIRQLLEWGVSFVKVDKCIHAEEWTEETLKETYFKWRNLLDNFSDEEVTLSISAYEWREWYPEIGQMSRTTEDISAKVAGMSGIDAVFDQPIPDSINLWGMLNVMEVSEENNRWAEKAGYGFWNDPDMLVVGGHGLTEEEQKSHFALWCIMSSPLFLGNDPRNMSDFEFELLSNKLAIAINQDPTEQGKRIKIEGPKEIWAKKLDKGKMAILFLNRNAKDAADFTLDIDGLDLNHINTYAEVFGSQHSNDFEADLSFEVPPSSSRFLLLRPE